MKTGALTVALRWQLVWTSVGTFPDFGVFVDQTAQDGPTAI